MRTVLITGSAGFIGFHVSRRLLKEGFKVIGIDAMTEYYDVSLKEARQKELTAWDSFHSVKEKIETPNFLMDLFRNEKPHLVVHLAAQAGVRYSIENPRSYLESNIIGTFELLEAARAYPPKHMLLASTSSAYGANSEMPYREIHKSDHQVSFYAATKKSTESIAHSYAHLFHLPITMFRFFTVYGPWGRPDMALFKFTKAIMEDDFIDVYNNGKMKRDFTFIDDLVHAIRLLIDAVPQCNESQNIPENDSISPVAPFRIVNIGNSKAINLLDFIEAIEQALNKKSKRNYLPMQAGDVNETWADAGLLHDLTGYAPQTELKAGIEEFVEWYQRYYKC